MKDSKIIAVLSFMQTIFFIQLVQKLLRELVGIPENQIFSIAFGSFNFLIVYSKRSKTDFLPLTCLKKIKGSVSITLKEDSLY